MSSARKKVIVRRLSGDFLPGYLAPSGFILQTAAETSIDLLDLDGHSLPLHLAEIKLICFVRDFNRDDLDNPERLTRKAFLARPRGEGLWVRLTFRGGDQLEGLGQRDTSLLDSILIDHGLFLIPPDERANTHRIYVPRPAISTLELLAVIQSPSRKPGKPSFEPPQQPLFPS